MCLIWILIGIKVTMCKWALDIRLHPACIVSCQIRVWRHVWNNVWHIINHKMALRSRESIQDLVILRIQIAILRSFISTSIVIGNGIFGANNYQVHLHQCEADSSCLGTPVYPSLATPPVLMCLKFMQLVANYHYSTSILLGGNSTLDRFELLIHWPEGSVNRRIKWPGVNNWSRITETCNTEATPNYS